ncbi:hypothetical protein V8F20_010554 [Naviculisporaceae sp. PSN 640]
MCKHMAAELEGLPAPKRMRREQDMEASRGAAGMDRDAGGSFDPDCTQCSEPQQLHVQQSLPSPSPQPIPAEEVQRHDEPAKTAVRPETRHPPAAADRVNTSLRLDRAPSRMNLLRAFLSRRSPGRTSTSTRSNSVFRDNQQREARPWPSGVELDLADFSGLATSQSQPRDQDSVPVQAPAASALVTPPPSAHSLPPVHPSGSQPLSIHVNHDIGDTDIDSNRIGACKLLMEYWDDEYNPRHSRPGQFQEGDGHCLVTNRLEPVLEKPGIDVTLCARLEGSESDTESYDGENSDVDGVNTEKIYRMRGRPILKRTLTALAEWGITKEERYDGIVWQFQRVIEDDSDSEADNGTT